MKKFFNLIGGLTVALSLVVVAPLPAHADTGSDHDAGTTQQELGYNFEAFQGTIFVSQPHAPSVQCSSVGGVTRDQIAHWIGIEGNAFLVQAGYDWVDPAADGHFKLQVWYEFYNTTWQDPPVMLYDQTQTPTLNHLGFTPAIGDPVHFDMWYHSFPTGGDAWGLQITDGSNIYSHYVYPSHGTSADWIQDQVVLDSERTSVTTPLGNVSYPLVNDGTTTYKQVQGFTLGAWYLVENMSGAHETHNMVNNLGQDLETASYPDSNAYAYHVWHQCA